MLDVEWSCTLDCFHFTVSNIPPLKSTTKRALTSDVAKIYDLLGWFAPPVIYVNVLLQLLWEAKIEQDDPVPLDTKSSWESWKTELPAFSQKFIARCYFPKDVNATSVQLHGFSDVAEDVYPVVVYLFMVDSNGTVHISLVMAKTKVALISA